MAYANIAKDRHDFVAVPAKPKARHDFVAVPAKPKARHDFVAVPAKPKARRGLLGRVFAAIVEARQRAADREVAAYLQGGGQFLTDEAERHIERILSSSSRL
jgi:hypothetical protein